MFKVQTPTAYFHENILLILNELFSKLITEGLWEMMQFLTFMKSVAIDAQNTNKDIPPKFDHLFEKCRKFLANNKYASVTRTALDSSLSILKELAVIF